MKIKCVCMYMYFVDSKHQLIGRRYNNISSTLFDERRRGGRGVIPGYVAGASSRRHGKHKHNLGNRHNNYMEFILIGVSISITILCRLI